MVERRAKETPSETKPLGRDIRSTKKVDYSKFEKNGESKFASHKAGDGYSHKGAAKATPSAGDERVRDGKVDYTKGTDKHGESKFVSKKAGDGYSHKGAAKETPSKGAERTEGAYKKKPHWRNV
jgi:hypothetical protein